MTGPYCGLRPDGTDALAACGLMALMPLLWPGGHGLLLWSHGLVASWSHGLMVSWPQLPAAECFTEAPDRNARGY